jgi:hypothetical protein
MNDMQIFVLCKRMAKKKRDSRTPCKSVFCVNKLKKGTHVIHSMQRTAKKGQHMRTKKGNLFKLSFFRAEVVISTKLISSAPK